ncbi:MAG: hypothetical protein JNL17_08300 [Cyclobacteriaceae bacterium]|nr:hypothetical protein [Cyclobacteriaceae bacterium]
MPSQQKPGKKKAKPRVHRELEGFEVRVNSFGEISSNLEIEKINEFLNRNVEDKKLEEREDYSELKQGKTRKRKKTR